MRRIAIALLFAIAACAPTDTGNPPAAFDGSSVEGTVAAGFLDPVVSIEGAPGTIEPGDGEVYLVMLEDPSRTGLVTVEPDGSFGAVSLSFGTNGPLRAFARTSEGLSPAIDWQIGTTLVALPRALDPCVRVVRVVELDSEGSASIPVANECDGGVTLLVSNIFGEGIAATPPAVLEPGAEGSIALTSPLPSSGFSIGTVELEVNGAVSGTLRLSVLGRAP